MRLRKREEIQVLLQGEAMTTPPHLSPLEAQLYAAAEAPPPSFPAATPQPSPNILVGMGSPAPSSIDGGAGEPCPACSPDYWIHGFPAGWKFCPMCAKPLP